MNNYDPNIRWAEHTVELTYMMWDYKHTAEVKIKGNIRGGAVLECAIETHADDLFEAFGECPTLLLSRPAEDGDGEDTLHHTPDLRDTDDEDCEEFEDLGEWLRRICVGIRIVKQERYSFLEAA